MKKLGLYIHIPFCKKKCDYCDFYSVCDLSSNKVDMYIDALCNHMKKEGHVYENCVFDTIFVGGGTPSILTPLQIEELFTCIDKEFKVSKNAEITIEANPSSINREGLLAMRRVGINRLSIGLQSTNDRELSCLGRLHNQDTFMHAYSLAKECGFENISVDIMYGLPNQKIDDLIKTLDQVCEISPKHISAYCLKIEENTPFGKCKDTLNLPNDDEEYEMYMTLCSYLNKRGYGQYEISNFAKNGYRSRHNIKYWQSEEYVGFGPSAHSYFNGIRYSYSRSLNDYLLACRNGTPIKLLEDENTDEFDHVSAKIDKMDEFVMLKLRLSDGISEQEFYEKFALSFANEYPKVSEFIASGHMKCEKGRYSFTPKGFFVSNYIYTEILHF